MLVTFEIQQGIKAVSPNNKVIFEQISEEVETLYLPKYLGDAFAYDVQTNPDTYNDLLNGVVFTDCDDNPIKFQGLLYTLAYFIFAEYLEKTKFKDTNTGFVLKNRDEAVTVSQGQESQLKNYNRKLAEYQVEVMRKYLNEESENYPLWDCIKRAKAYTPKFRTIKRTKS